MQNLKDFETSLVLALRGTSPLTTADIKQKAEILAPVFGLENYPIEQIIKSVETKLVTTMSEGISLVDQCAEHDDLWYEKKEIGGNYWSDYERHLQSEGWGPHVVNTMGNGIFITRNILLKFLTPEIQTGFRCISILTARMAMPEAAMNKDHCPVFRKNNIRFPWKCFIRNSESVPHTMQY